LGTGAITEVEDENWREMLAILFAGCVVEEEGRNEIARVLGAVCVKQRRWNEEACLVRR
jgi:hypothetical protein